MLAMNQRTPRATRHPASSLTTIATVRRFDMLAPTVLAAYEHPLEVPPNLSITCAALEQSGFGEGVVCLGLLRAARQTTYLRQG
jgi:hypothetical protein